MNMWNKKGIPHKGWEWVYSTDCGSDHITCEMCGKERVRYSHTMQHSEVVETIDVGCVCAGKMCDDYGGIKSQERKLRNKAARRDNWLRRKWEISFKGNPYMNVDGKSIGVHKVGNNWGFRIEGKFSKITFSAIDDAKLALFEEIDGSNFLE